MHNYPISKKIVNVTNNVRAIKALWVIKKICHQEQESMNESITVPWSSHKHRVISKDERS